MKIQILDTRQSERDVAIAYFKAMNLTLDKDDDILDENGSLRGRLTRIERNGNDWNFVVRLELAMEFITCEIVVDV